MSGSVKVIQRRNNDASAARRKLWSPGSLFLVFTLVVISVYALALSSFLQQSSLVKEQPGSEDLTSLAERAEMKTNADQIDGKGIKLEHPKTERRTLNNGHKTYEDWREVVIQLARLPAADLLTELKTNDPFGTRAFEKNLLESETQKAAILDETELRKLFPCPMDRITLPDQRNLTRVELFRSKAPGYFLFFQHLRKAGGTNFCTLAKENLPKSEIGRYYCMSDYDWALEQNKVMAGYLHHWSNEEITRRMAESGHRITGNEWDNFNREEHFDLPAIYATSFRRPLDRALSQFRFECVEDRGCKFKDVGKWWEHRRDLYNVYTATFADQRRAGIVPSYEQNSEKHKEIRAQLMAKALDTVANFHLVLSMEFLAYARPQVESILGFTNTESLTKRVRPHIGQAKRDDGQDVNKLGAAGIAKASWTPEEYLTPEQYKDFSEHLALDELLTDAARRMFLERTVCDDLAA